jgi:hypothetical protein
VAWTTHGFSERLSPYLAAFCPSRFGAGWSLAVIGLLDFVVWFSHFETSPFLRINPAITAESPLAGTRISRMHNSNRAAAKKKMLHPLPQRPRIR